MLGTGTRILPGLYPHGYGDLQGIFADVMQIVPTSSNEVSQYKHILFLNPKNVYPEALLYFTSNVFGHPVYVS